MAWETCPECGKKVYGYLGFLEHIAKHPSLRNKQTLQLAIEMGWFAFLHERIKRHKIDIAGLEAKLAEEVKP